MGWVEYRTYGQYAPSPVLDFGKPIGDGRRIGTTSPKFTAIPMKVRYLLTVSTASLLSLGLVFGCSNPCAAQEAPAGETTEQANPCASDDPCAAKENPCASKENPCASDDPCAAKENPCAAE
jgi:hypothetical protein